MNNYTATTLAAGLLVALLACQKSAKKDAFGQDYSDIPPGVAAGSQPGATGASSANIGGVPAATWTPLAPVTEEAAATAPVVNVSRCRPRPIL